VPLQEALGVARNMRYRWKENAEKQKAGISLAEDERTELKGLRSLPSVIVRCVDPLSPPAPALQKK